MPFLHGIDPILQTITYISKTFFFSLLFNFPFCVFFVCFFCKFIRMTRNWTHSNMNYNEFVILKYNNLFKVRFIAMISNRINSSRTIPGACRWSIALYNNYLWNIIFTKLQSTVNVVAMTYKKIAHNSHTTKNCVTHWTINHDNQSKNQNL